ncbi:hypothetical protein NEOLEDRAFT_1150430 [Neolentinus lepideus HHB14362 ss-1]|uniref:Uncharacterized protein n=1 Tax=Neolentinus lepideus HHB14362 ss-1 TaxID=1314782 RepID=A0A165Q2U9_9AGAM|nr:hypothetical protein NEOLEDRAFT_1150430 [Neolentinus lepideus HHB14362 ss-1]
MDGEVCGERWQRRSFSQERWRWMAMGSDDDDDDDGSPEKLRPISLQCVHRTPSQQGRTYNLQLRPSDICASTGVGDIEYQRVEAMSTRPVHMQSEVDGQLCMPILVYGEVVGREKENCGSKDCHKPLLKTRVRALGVVGYHARLALRSMREGTGSIPVVSMNVQVLKKATP